MKTYAATSAPVQGRIEFEDPSFRPAKAAVRPEPNILAPPERKLVLAPRKCAACQEKLDARGHRDPTRCSRSGEALGLMLPRRLPRVPSRRRPVPVGATQLPAVVAPAAGSPRRRSNRRSPTPRPASTTMADWVQAGERPYH